MSHPVSDEIAIFLILQTASLADPVLAIHPATESPQLLSHAVDIIFAHFCNLIEPIYAEIVQGPFDRRADALDHFKVIRGVVANLTIIDEDVCLQRLLVVVEDRVRPFRRVVGVGFIKRVTVSWRLV